MFSFENFRDLPLAWLAPVLLTGVVYRSVILHGFDLKGIP